MQFKFFGPNLLYLLIFVAVILVFVSGFGITAGAHRLWAHRAFKAKLPLRILLVAFQTTSYSFNIIDWALDHRVHHKYSETDADPYNAKRYLADELPNKYANQFVITTIHIMQWFLVFTCGMDAMQKAS